ncbi:tetratricopeptide repeat protein, partial [Algoriella sp.]|uniref:tetratricopeptide repeat protein n=1 Tax=Algoriella sp. TaxID=1872434 RepID=UPI001B22DF87
MLKKLLNKNIFLFVIVFISFTVKISAQTDLNTALSSVERNTVDGKYDEALKELDALYKKNKSNSLNTVMIYGSYVNVYSNKKEFEKAFYYSSLAKDISDKTPDKLDDAYTLHAFAKIYLINQLYDKTISYSNKALNILKKFPNEHLLKSRLYLLMSLTHSRTNVYSEEYKNYVLEAVSQAQQQKEPLQHLGAYTEATLMYISAYEKTKNEEDLKNIFKYAELTLSYINENNVKTLPKKAIATAYNNMASLVNTYPYKNYSKQEKFKIAEDYLKKAIEIADDKETILTCYATFAEIQENQNNNDLAEEYYLKSYELAKNSKNNVNLYALSYITNAISILYKKQNKTAEALKFSEE